MPTYASQADMVSRFGESEMVEATALNDPETTEIVASVLADALADADAEINSYLATRYSLPLADVPRILLPVACDIARYRLWKEKASESVGERHRAAIAFLKDVSAGRAALGITTEQDATPAPTGGVQISEACNRITHRDLRDW